MVLVVKIVMEGFIILVVIKHSSGNNGSRNRSHGSSSNSNCRK